MEKMAIQHELMSVREVAEELGLARTTAYELVKTGRFRVYRPSYKGIRVFREDVMAHKAASFFGGLKHETALAG